ncbi:MAG: LysM peptidoglycan-binding domain-containing protein [Christensenellaceae bacterium]|nr:LysM peptidoglycan-binding domain-containing protein [Christensenellaceae bacterium]
MVGPKTWTYLLESVEEPAPCTGDEPTPSPEPTPDCTPYTVKAGDTLWKLAERYGTTVAAIKAASGITSDNLQIGQQLCIPSGGGTGCTPYTVKAGDTLWALANRYGTTVNAIKAASGITSDRLQIGQQLCIPN